MTGGGRGVSAFAILYGTLKARGDGSCQTILIGARSIQEAAKLIIRDWKTETSPYIPRLDSLVKRLERLRDFRTEKSLDPFAGDSSEGQALAVQLIIFSRNGVLIVEQLLGSVLLLWSGGRMVGIPSLVRAALEYWAAVHFACHIFDRYENDKDIKLAFEQCRRLTQGARTPVKVPWGGETDSSSYSVLKFVELLDKSYAGISDAYAVLSEGTHPNHFQNVYFLFASNGHDNFTNDSFRTHAHALLSQVLDAAEMTVDGLTSDHQKLMEIGARLSCP